MRVRQKPAVTSAQRQEDSKKNIYNIFESYEKSRRIEGKFLEYSKILEEKLEENSRMLEEKII